MSFWGYPNIRATRGKLTNFVNFCNRPKVDQVCSFSYPEKLSTEKIRIDYYDECKFNILVHSGRGVTMIKSLILLPSLVFGSIQGFSQARPHEAEQVIQVGVHGQDLDITTLRAHLIKQFISAPADMRSATRGPAPSLSELQLLAIASANHPDWEYLWNPNFYTTPSNHGGAWMVVATFDLGYGNNPICRINGFNLTSIQVETITDASGIVIGFIRYWNANGYQGGACTYQNTSTNSPWNTMSDSATIL